VHTVISTIATIDDTASQSQLNLIHAASASTTVKRFIPSDFGIPYRREHVEIFPLVAYKLAASALLASLQAPPNDEDGASNGKGKKALEFCLIHCGIFLDFFCWSKSTYLKAGFPLVVDLDNDVAAIPGTGEEKVVFTHTWDTAKFVVAVLGLDRWEKDVYVVGEKMSWKDVAQNVETAKGTPLLNP
jgi:hypothetical protein